MALNRLIGHSAEGKSFFLALHLLNVGYREGFSFFLANSHNRGAAGTAAGMGTTGAGSSSSGVTTVAAAASETPRRWARAERERAGASPRVRSAASNTGNRTWIH